jgi:hypothetical protein
MLHHHADEAQDPHTEWACYSLLNDLTHCDDQTNEACWGDEPVDNDADLQTLIEMRFGYLVDNTRDLFDGSGSYDNTQPEVNSLLAYRLLTR